MSGGDTSTTIRRHVERHIVGYVALFVALGGTAIALPARNSVDSGDIKPKNVRRSDLAPNSVNSSKVKNGTVASADVADNAVTGADIHDSSVTGADVAGDSITGGQVNESSLLGVNADTLEGHHSVEFAAPEFAHISMSGPGFQEFAPVGYSTAAPFNYARAMTAPSPMVVRDFHVDPLAGNGGSGTDWTVTMFTNGQSPTPLRCRFDSVNLQSCTDPDTAFIDTSHIIGLDVTTTGSPTSAEIAVSWRAAAP